MLLCVHVSAVSLHARQEPSRARSLGNALSSSASGEEIYQMACATCHGDTGRGSPQHVVGFELPLPNGHSFPDFTDCAANTVEPIADWTAVAHSGGPVRGLDRHMPAFGDALRDEQLERVVQYVRSFCTDPSWPRGELNLPRALLTEKAFPENEAVFTTSVSAAGPKHVSHEVVYERRVGARSQFEVAVPIEFQQRTTGERWHVGLGDVELAWKHDFYHNVNRGSIFAAGGAVALPTGKEATGLGNGFTIVEPFALWGQLLGANGFVQLHAGVEVPTNRGRGDVEPFVRTAFGYTLAEDSGLGRAWVPMVELLMATPDGRPPEWDVVPELQVSLSKLQHVLLNVGVRVPINERAERKPQVLTYLLWDWYDGGLLQFWK
jgi:hypothetical protein